MNDNLRHRAENLLNGQNKKPERKPAEEDIQKLIHELQVHKVELEMQNEELVRAKEEIEAALIQYQELYDLSPVGYFTISEHGLILEVNLTGAALLGIKRKELINTSFLIWVYHEYRHDYLKFMKKLSEDFSKESCEVEMMKDKTASFHAHIEGRTDESKKLYYLAVADVSELKHAEEERKKLEDNLRQAQKMEAIGQLAGGIAHDFNNILYVITGYSEIVAQQLPAGILHKNMKEIMKAVQRGATLIRQLLLFSRREAMQLKYLDLNQLISDLMKMIKRVIGEHVTPEVRPGFKLRNIYADPGQIEQVIVNLCINSRDAMPDGGKIVIETENITIDDELCKKYTWAKEGDYVLLTVSDTGIGIPHDIQDQVFEPFFTTKEVGKGTGLGLVAVYGIVRSHYGFIRLYSEPEQGTAFGIYLPAAESSQNCSDDEQESSERLKGGNETIFIAEDEESVRIMMVEILKKVGYRVLAAKDGEEAISLFEKHFSEIDLAILDVIMPKVSGQKIFEKIRTIRHDMPVIFITGYDRGVLKSLSFPDDTCEIIQKPFSSSLLLRKIRSQIEKKKELNP